MGRVLTFYKSTPGKKAVVAITGLLLFGFVIGHMAGNLKAFAGEATDGVHKLDHYAHFLRTIGSEMLGHGGFLWATRLGLLGVFLLHIATVLQLQRRNSAARPTGYVKFSHQASSLAARSMMLGGIVIFCFVVFHIAHLTLGWVQPALFEHGHVYANVFAAFQNPVLVILYCVAMVFVGLHLFHGLWSLFQTLGLDRPDRNCCFRCAAKTLSIVIALGFMAVPVAIYAGIVTDPPAQFLEM